VAEAPPNDINRFFYYTNVKDHDHLFLAIMEVLYPLEKQAYLKSGRSAKLKDNLLRRFQADGFFLLDVLDVPIRHSSQQLKDAVPNLIARLKEVVALDLSTPIILIKASVYEVAYLTLKREGFNVINARSIPFPSSGQQGNFRREFSQVIELL
jgi:hypothetical protein